MHKHTKENGENGGESKKEKGDENEQLLSELFFGVRSALQKTRDDTQPERRSNEEKKLCQRKYETRKNKLRKVHV